MPENTVVDTMSLIKSFWPHAFGHCEPFPCKIRNSPGDLVSVFRAFVAKWRSSYGHRSHVTKGLGSCGRSKVVSNEAFEIAFALRNYAIYAKASSSNGTGQDSV